MVLKLDTAFKYICFSCAGIIGLCAVGFFIQLLYASLPAWRECGWEILTGTQWDPVAGTYGALPAIAGTLATTAIALIVAWPIAFLSAFFLMDAPPWLSDPLSHAIDLLAAVPSVIFGMWGLFVFAPVMQWIFPDSMGIGLLTAGLVLSLMILPYICAIMREVFKATPQVLRESAFGIGCMRWEVAKDIMLRYGMGGLIGGTLIGLGRALGETMAVLFVVGNLMIMPVDLFGGATTISATLANSFGEAHGLERSVLFALGLILLVLAMSIQVVAQYYLAKTKATHGGCS